MPTNGASSSIRSNRLPLIFRYRRSSWSCGSCAVRQRQVQFQSFRIALPPVDAIQQAGRIHQLLDHFYFARAQALGIERHVHGFKFRHAGGKVGGHDQLGRCTCTWRLLGRGGVWLRRKSGNNHYCAENRQGDEGEKIGFGHELDSIVPGKHGGSAECYALARERRKRNARKKSRWVVPGLRACATH